MAIQHAGFMLLRSVLALAAGGGAVLGGSYLASKLKGRQEMENRLDRIEEMLQQLAKPEPKPAAAKPAAARSAKAKVAKPDKPA